MTKENLLSALETFVRQRPGFERGNYGDRASYMRDVRSATRDLHHARALIRWARSTPIPYDVLTGVMAWRERLSWSGARVYYCTGQYWPTEYRAAVVSALSRAVRAYARDYCGRDTREEVERYARDCLPPPVARRVG
jgi:hypothetical protein